MKFEASCSVIISVSKAYYKYSFSNIIILHLSLEILATEIKIGVHIINHSIVRYMINQSA